MNNEAGAENPRVSMREAAGRSILRNASMERLVGNLREGSIAIGVG